MQTRDFSCQDGVTFSVILEKEAATVVTLTQRYMLSRRRSSLGIRYASRDVAFAQDEDRAVLVGAADGPYTNCTEQQQQPEPG